MFVRIQALGGRFRPNFGPPPDFGPIFADLCPEGPKPRVGPLDVANPIVPFSTQLAAFTKCVYPPSSCKYPVKASTLNPERNFTIYILRRRAHKIDVACCCGTVGIIYGGLCCSGCMHRRAWQLSNVPSAQLGERPAQPHSRLSMAGWRVCAGAGTCLCAHGVDRLRGEILGSQLRISSGRPSEEVDRDGPQSRASAARRFVAQTSAPEASKARPVWTQGS